MNVLDDLAERATPMGIGVAGVIGAVLPLVGQAWLPLIGDVILGLVGAATLGAAALLARRGATLRALPLELGRFAVVEPVDGQRVVKVRFRLGRGRGLRDVAASARFVAADGRARELGVRVPARSACGIVTLTAIDPDGVTAGPGALEVKVTVTSDRRAWTAERAWKELRDGRFVAPVVAAGGRLVHVADGWDELRPAEPADDPRPGALP